MDRHLNAQYQVDLEGRFEGPRPTGPDLHQSQVICVLIAALRNQGFNDASEVVIEGPDGQCRVRGHSPEGSSTIQLEVQASSSDAPPSTQPDSRPEEER